MKSWYPLALAAAFAVVGYSAVLDLGDINQYAPKLTALPDGIQVDSIWVSPADEGGFHVVLGQDIKAKVDGVLEGCGALNDKCYQEVLAVLEDGVMQTDKKLEGRQVIAALVLLAAEFITLDTLITVVAIVETTRFAAFLALPPPLGIYFPEDKAKPAGTLPQGPVTVSAGGSAVITITQGPTPQPTLKGSVPPIVTAVTSAAGDFQTGDLAGILDRGLAGRLDEFMQRSKECKAGDDFDKQHASPARKRAVGSYGEALCASEAVIGGIQPGGLWNDLLLLEPTGVHFGFKTDSDSGTASAAASQFSEFARAYAPLMDVSPERADQIGSYILALAVDTIVQGVALSEKNRIPATMVTTSGSPSPTGTGCPDKNTIICGIPVDQHCNFKFAGQGNARKPVCEDGPYKDCECTGPALTSTEMFIPERQKAFVLFMELVKAVPATPQQLPTCPIVVTEIPAELFSSRKTATLNIHNNFCQGWKKDAKHSITVNSKGEDVLTVPREKPVTAASRLRRAPPANPDSFAEFRFDLSFTPSGGGACTMDCNAAYAQFAKTCAASSPGIYMYEKGSYNVGCGTFTYQIIKPAAFDEYPRICYKRKQLPPINDTLVEKTLSAIAETYACVDGRKNLIKKGDTSTFVSRVVWVHGGTDKFIPTQLNIWWRDGCILEKNGPTESHYELPLGEGKPKCVEIFKSLYEKCAAEDEKVGGNAQMGCLMYELKASDVKRTTWGGSQEK
ncbi:hypothetical protein B0T14DRAFT_605745 [Immersiella caudata]|uniref:Uncharacterized protein n=1 Tax=Immersiella caudata TaxID=314043 RepID=A0AA39WLR3_9PEZI|nr:hypothetical protein B0T14DRAFT_605745 [Immersiella caudata]